MSWVSGCQGDPFKDEVSNVELPRIDQRIMVLSHQLLAACHPQFHVQPYLIKGHWVVHLAISLLPPQVES